MTDRQIFNRFHSDGYILLDCAIGAEYLEGVVKSIQNHPDSPYGVKRRGEIYAYRNILNSIPAVWKVACSDRIVDFAKEMLGESVRPTKAILFDKTDRVNWSLRWHQDVTISVKEKIDVPGYGPWSMKLGVHHVQPPMEIMNSIIAARVHIDDCDEDNGALRVLPGSHLNGRLSQEEMQEWKLRTKPAVCPARRGDVLFMRPLLLHSSRRSENTGHRRVLHIEYSARELPGGLEWYG